MKKGDNPARTTSWYRALGRLHRYTEAMRHMRAGSREREAQGPRAPTPPLTSAVPTDPEVFHARPPTPHPSPIYDIPIIPGHATLTPTHLLEDLLNRIDEEGIDVVGNVRPGTTEDPPPAYDNVEQPPALPRRPPTQLDRPFTYREYMPPTVASSPERPESTGSLVETTYVQMASRTATRGSTATQSSTRQSMETQPRTPQRNGTPPRQPNEPEAGYENLNEPGRYNHPPDERVIPIPQGSPPFRPPMELPTPAYYRDYNNPDVFPAYRLICHSVWYVQVSPDVIICAECATSEHAFCISNRPLSVWRHLHVISREFHHTTMHCGRCYKLLMKTKRAVDCYQCRSTVIDLRGHTERLVYKVLCEIVVPRNIA